MTAEVWRPVPDFPGYEVSNLGNVRSYYSRNGRGALKAEPRLLEPCLNTTGYPHVGLRRDGRRNTRTVHRLVMLAFVGPRPEGMEVRHLNGDKLDSRLVNLAYGTSRENGTDRIALGEQIYGRQCHLAKLDEAKVQDIHQRLRRGETHRSIADAHGVSRTSIGYIAQGRTWWRVSCQL